MTRIKLSGKTVAIPTEFNSPSETTRMKLVGMTESEVEEFCGAAYDRGWYPDVDFEPLYGAGWALTGVQVTGLNYFAEAINILRAIRS